jgi:4-nitrophenyl phosphatase
LAVIGDDPALEVLMAHRGKAFAVGVTTGIAKEEDFARVTKDNRAHIVSENIGAFLTRYRTATAG